MRFQKLCFLAGKFEICGLYYKTSMIVIYDRKDSGLYYKTTITIVFTILAKDRIINYYDRKLHSKLKRNLRS